MGYELYRAYGLPVPAWKVLRLTDSFIDRHPECWFETEHSLVKPAPGLCFGSLYLGTAGARLIEILPETSYSRIRTQASFWLAWVLDICAHHADNRQALFVPDAKGQYEALFIDSGHFFGGPKGNSRPHYISSRYLDPRIYPDITARQYRGFRKVLETVDADKLWRQAAALPDAWKTASALKGFEGCLHRLSDLQQMHILLDAMIDLNGRRIGSDHCSSQNGRKPPVSVLCPGVQTGVAAPGAVSWRTGRIACGQG